MKTNFRPAAVDAVLPLCSMKKEQRGSACLLFILTLFCFAFIALPSYAQTSASSRPATLVLNEQTRHIPLAAHFIRITENADLLDATKIIEQELWKRTPLHDQAGDDHLNLSAGDTPVWFVLPVRNNSARTQWYLDFGELADGRLGIIRSAAIYIHTPNPYEAAPATSVLLEGDAAAPVMRVPSIAGEEIHNGRLLSLTLPARQNSTIILKLSPVSRLPAILTPSLVHEDQALPLTESRHVTTFILLACLCAMGVFFLAFSAAIESYVWVSFLFYYVLCIALGALQHTVLVPFTTLTQQALSFAFPLMGVLSVLMTRTCLATGHVNPRENALYHSLLLIAGLGAIAGLLMPGDLSAFRTALMIAPTLIVLATIGIYSIIKYEYGQACRLFIGTGWMIGLAGIGITLMWILGVVSFASPLKNAFWFSLVPQGFCFIAATLLKNAGRVKTTQADGSTANLDIEALVKLRQTKESAEHGRLLRVIEKERELLTQFRQREAQRTEEMQHAKEMADIANKAKSAFLAVVSHEIRTPMTGVMGMVRLLLETKLTKDQKDYVTTIQESGDSMLTLLNDILDFEKIERGKMELENISFDLPRLIQSVATLMSGHATIKNISLKTIIDPEVPRVVMGDPSRLRQVLLNLTGNAIKFTSQGEVVLKIHLHRPDDKTLEKRGSEKIYDIYFAVKDSGIGISPEAMENIFTPFAQADSSISRKFGGTGLGLAICKGLIERMGSKIHISSREGEGSMFFFTLPMRAGEDDASDIASTSTGSSAVAPARRKLMRSLHVLVVDDNAINQKVVTSFLSRLNHTADTADTAESALAIIQKKIYDLILMDIQLPGMPGDEATRVLRKLPDPEKSSLPVIALTGNTRDEDIALYRRAGMNGFVAKPIDPDQLRDVIDQVMGTDEPATQPMASIDDDEPDPGWPEFEDNEPAFTPASDIPVFNTDMMDTLKINLGRDKLHELLNELTVKTHELVGALEDAYQRRDQTMLRARAHEIKGMTGNFGLDELSQIAAHIERIARNESMGVFETASPHITALRPALARAEAALTAWTNA